MKMKNSKTYLLISLLIISILSTSCSATTTDAKKPEAMERITKIIELEEGQDISEIIKNLKNVEVSELKGGRYIIKTDGSTEKIEQELSAMKGIRRIDKSRSIGIIKPIEKIKIGKDFIIEKLTQINDIEANDPGVKSQWAVSYTNANNVWNLVEQKKTINVAVIDTGVDYNHPDLINRVNREKGYDFVNEDSDAMDDNGHGTHVSGIIAAEMNNNEGIVGVVGPLDVSIIPIKVLDAEGGGQSEVVAKGIEYAVEQGAHIINLSLGGPGEDVDIGNAIQYAAQKGVLVVAASGNENQSCDTYTPAGLEKVYTVAAVNPLKIKARFSNYGDSVDVAAPGVKILSTVPGTEYEAWDGTSMAAPVVTGVAAIMLSHSPELSVTDIVSIVNQSAHDISKPGQDQKTGYGLLNAEMAWRLLTGEEEISGKQETMSSNTSKSSSNTISQQNDQKSLSNSSGEFRQKISEKISQKESTRDFSAIKEKLQEVTLEDIEELKKLLQEANLENYEELEKMLQEVNLENYEEIEKLLEEIDEEELDEFIKEFEANHEVNKQYLKEIYEGLETLIPLTQELETAYNEGTLQLTLEQMYEIQTKLKEVEEKIEYVETKSQEIKILWEEIISLLSEGQIEEAKELCPEILEIQEAFTHYLESVLNEINYIIQFIEEIL